MSVVELSVVEVVVVELSVVEVVVSVSRSLLLLLTVALLKSFCSVHAVSKTIIIENKLRNLVEYIRIMLPNLIGKQNCYRPAKIFSDQFCPENLYPRFTIRPSFWTFLFPFVV